MALMQNYATAKLLDSRLMSQDWSETSSFNSVWTPIHGWKGALLSSTGLYRCARFADNKIFPEADEWLSKLNERPNASNTGPRMFCHMRIYLRKVLLQGAPSLRENYGHLPIFAHSLFLSNEYLAYERYARQVLSTLQPPVEFQIQASGANGGYGIGHIRHEA